MENVSTWMVGQGNPDCYISLNVGSQSRPNQVRFWDTVLRNCFLLSKHKPSRGKTDTPVPSGPQKEQSCGERSCQTVTLTMSQYLLSIFLSICLSRSLPRNPVEKKKLPFQFMLSCVQWSPSLGTDFLECYLYCQHDCHLWVSWPPSQ